MTQNRKRNTQQTGFTLLEAMIAGKAIIASATSGIPEAIESGHEGILVSPGDAGPLARALQSLLTDDARRAALGAAASQRARGEFTVQVMADRYEALYAGTPGLRGARKSTRVAGFAATEPLSERLTESLA